MRLTLCAPNPSLSWSPRPGSPPVPTGSTPLDFLLELPDAELQSLLFAAATAFVAEYKLTLDGLEARLTSFSPTSARVDVRATVRKSLLKATATLTATAAVDDRLVLRLTGLRARGEGLLAALIDSLINPKLAPFDGRAIPLARNLPEGFRVTHLTLTPGPPTHTLAATVQLTPP